MIANSKLLITFQYYSGKYLRERISGYLSSKHFALEQIKFEYSAKMLAEQTTSVTDSNNLLIKVQIDYFIAQNNS